jgi:SAM-dependent methyltransferase
MPNYRKDFYKDQEKGSRQSAKVIVPLVMDLVDVKSVLDVGCGTGEWLSEFKEHHVDDIHGVDGDWLDRNLLKIPKDRFKSSDLKEPFDLKRKYDLVMSLEVAEHLPRESAAAFVRSLTRHGPVVLFSAAIPFQGGKKHENEQWPDYWVEQFASLDYVVLDPIRERVWNNENVDFWYAQNMLMFVKKDYLQGHPPLSQEAKRTKNKQLSIVHPKQHMIMHSRTDPKFLSLREVIRAIPILLKDKVLGRKRSRI